MPPQSLPAACGHSPRDGTSPMSSRMHQFRSLLWAQSTTFKLERKFHAPPSDKIKSGKTPSNGCKPFGSYSHLVTITKIGLLCPSFVVDYTSPSTSNQLHAFVWRCNGSGPRYFVCASFGFSNPRHFWRREFSPNERNAESINLSQPNVELFLIRVDEPSQSQQLHQT